jgi:hypothetical protein
LPELNENIRSARSIYEYRKYVNIEVKCLAKTNTLRGGKENRIKIKKREVWPEFCFSRHVITKRVT